MTSDADDFLPRGHRGRWRKQVESYDRDARAALLAAQGWTYERIAVELGYGSKQAAHRGAKQALMQLSSVRKLAEMREQAILENNEARRIAWRTACKPPQLVDRLGRPCKDDKGRPILDEQARQGALLVIARYQDRLAKLTGMDAPRRSISASVDLSSMSIADAREYVISQGASPEDVYGQAIAGEIEP